MKDDLKMMKVAMVLFAVILIYVMIRKPSESLKPDESSGESVGEFQKVQDDSQSGNAFAKRRASESDWEKVRAIAEKFSPQIADLERELFDFTNRSAGFQNANQNQIPHENGRGCISEIIL